MLRDLIRVLEQSNATSLDISIRREGDAMLTVELRTRLGAVKPELDASAAQLRAALTHPLVLRGTIAEFDGGGLATALQSYANTLTPVASSFGEAVAAFKEQAARAAEKAKSRPKKPSSKSAPAEAADDDDDENEQNVSGESTGSSDVAAAPVAPVASFDQSNPASLL